MKTQLRLIVAAFVLAAFNVSAATLHVSLESPNPVPPFTNWATAATNIQDAVDAAKTGDTVLVTNGVYATGERDVLVLDTNLQPPQLVSGGLSRVVVTNSIRLESVNGPRVTTIQGICLTNEYGHVTNGIRCMFLGYNAIVSGFTLANGGLTWNDIGEPGASGDHIEAKGAGVYASSTNAMVTNCVVVGNRTGPSGGWSLGGGVFSGTLRNCVLTNNVGANGGGAFGSVLYHCDIGGNSALGFEGPGGGASESTLYDCTLTGNSAPGWGGGGAWQCTLYNCILTGNWAGSGAGGASSSSLFNCVVTGNSASWGGGGAYDCILQNCTVTGNSAMMWGGGVAYCRVYNCIVYYNTAPNGPNYLQGESSGPISFSCTIPLPTNGVGNITGPPLFMDMAAGDLRLWEDSPCIDAGTNLLGCPIMSFTSVDGGGRDWVVVGYNHNPTDILGNTRFIDGNGDGIVAWDIGAYEFNSFKPPRFTAPPQRTAEGWRLNITGEPNKRTRVQRSRNLSNWEEWYWGILPADGVLHITDTETNQMMFYRAVVP